MSDFDIDDFKLTRLSDIIGNVADDDIEDSGSDIDDVGLAELKTLIKEIKQQWGVESVLETTNGNQYIKPLKTDGAISKRDFDQMPVDGELIPQIKYGREEILMLATSPICKLPPPDWKDLVNELPTVLTSPHLPFDRLKYTFNVDDNKKTRYTQCGLQFAYDPCNDDWVSPLSRMMDPLAKDEDHKELEATTFEAGDTGPFTGARRKAYKEILKAKAQEEWTLGQPTTDVKKVLTGGDLINKQVKHQVNERPQKSVQGLGPQLFQRAMADLSKQ